MDGVDWVDLAAGRRREHLGLVAKLPGYGEDRGKDLPLTPEYYFLKHASHFVKSGARVLELGGDWEDSLGFLNPDGRVVLLLGNQNEDEKAISIRVSGKSLAVNLPASSVNTIVL